MNDRENTLDNMLDGQDVRLREVSVMVPTDGTLTAEHLTQIRGAAARYIKRRGYALALVAQKLGTNQTYISNFLSGSQDAIPAKTLQALARQINEWLDLDNARQARRGEKCFVHTKVAQRLIKIARHAVETGDIAVAHGPAGCGKTATLEQLRTLIPASIYLYITPDSARRSGFLRALYEAVWEHRGPRRPTLADVLERLRQSDRLLMLDNADELHPDVYPILMALHDVAEIPILIVGTYKLLTRLQHDADPLRGQMSSRIGIRAELLAEQTSPRRGRGPREWITAAEIRSIFERGRIKLHPDTVSRLCDIANNSIGRLRRCERYLRYATIMATSNHTSVITLELLDKAIVLVDGAAPPASPPPAETLEATA